MKNILRLLTAFAVILLMASACEKNGAPRFKGNYTFKTGGMLTVKALVPANEPEDPIEPEERDNTDESESRAENESDENEELSTMAIVPESGQMDIIVTDKASGSMIVTMNIIGGTVVTFDATADGKTLNLSPLRRQITLNPSNYSSEALRPTADVEISGCGERFDNIIIFRLEYQGSYIYAGTEYEIVASSVDCIAKENS